MPGQQRIGLPRAGSDTQPEELLHGRPAEHDIRPRSPAGDRHRPECRSADQRTDADQRPTADGAPRRLNTRPHDTGARWCSAFMLTRRTPLCGDASPRIRPTGRSHRRRSVRSAAAEPATAPTTVAPAATPTVVTPTPAAPAAAPTVVTPTPTPAAAPAATPAAAAPGRSTCTTPGSGVGAAMAETAAAVIGTAIAAPTSTTFASNWHVATLVSHMNRASAAIMSRGGPPDGASRHTARNRPRPRRTFHVAVARSHPTSPARPAAPGGPISIPSIRAPLFSTVHSIRGLARNH